jgi:hypothetical protein
MSKRGKRCRFVTVQKLQRSCCGFTGLEWGRLCRAMFCKLLRLCQLAVVMIAHFVLLRMLPASSTSCPNATYASMTAITSPALYSPHCIILSPTPTSSISSAFSTSRPSPLSPLLSSISRHQIADFQPCIGIRIPPASASKIYNETFTLPCFSSSSCMQGVVAQRGETATAATGCMQCVFDVGKKCSSNNEVVLSHLEQRAHDCHHRRTLKTRRCIDG